jgi:acyl-CoA thioester hydrolase
VRWVIAGVCPPAPPTVESAGTSPGAGWRSCAGFRQDRPITDFTTTTLAITHRSTVTDGQIDHLGHMNVRFYGANAQSGTATLLGELAHDEAVTFTPFDVYTRHHREQLLGARLVVRSGVIGVDAGGLRLYHELLEQDTETLAATFVHRLRCATTAGEACPLPASIAERARARIVAVPEHGATRSIDLACDPVATAPDLAAVLGNDLAMRKVRPVTAEECDGTGAFVWSNAPGLTWGGEPLHRRLPEMVYDGPAGERMGWASMETRLVIRRLPRLGDTVQSFSAVIGLADKTSHRIQWAYDVERGDLLTTFEVVNLAFDTNARRPMSIPAGLREGERAVLHEELAPRPPVDDERAVR